MSIETDLNRIAIALEGILEVVRKGPMPQATAPVKESKVKKAEPTAPVVEEPVAEPDMFGNEEEPTPVVSFDKLSDTLKNHAKALGTKTTIALIKKHGADNVTPKINTIPEKNWAACLEEAEKDLKKIKKA